MIIEAFFYNGIILKIKLIYTSTKFKQTICNIAQSTIARSPLLTRHAALHRQKTGYVWNHVASRPVKKYEFIGNFLPIMMSLWFSLLNVTSQFPFTGLQDIPHDALAERPRVVEVYSHRGRNVRGYAQRGRNTSWLYSLQLVSSMKWVMKRQTWSVSWGVPLWR